MLYLIQQHLPEHIYQGYTCAWMQKFIGNTQNIKLPPIYKKLEAKDKKLSRAELYAMVMLGSIPLPLFFRPDFTW